MRPLVIFAGVFEGGYRKVGWLAWFFTGDSVVFCVANVV
jgi:hypothetical protein